MAGTGKNKPDLIGNLSLKAMAQKARDEVQRKSAESSGQIPSHARQKNSAQHAGKSTKKKTAAPVSDVPEAEKPRNAGKRVSGKAVKLPKLPAIHADQFAAKVENLPLLSAKFLPVRLIIASVIFIFTLIFRRLPGYAEIPLLILAALLAGFDLIPSFLSKVSAKKFSDPAVPVVLSVLIGFCLGFAAESAATVILYKIGLLLISYTTEKTAQSALELIDPQSEEAIELYSTIADDVYSDHLRIGSVALKSAGTVFRVAFIVAVLYAILLPLISNFSLRVSLHRAATIILIANPLSVIAAISPVGRVGLGSAASKGFLFRNADTLEDLSSVQTIIFDNDLLEVSEALKVEAVKTESVDKDTFLNLLYHLVYQSRQYFADVIKKTYHYDYIPQIITDFTEIEGFGVEAKINSVPVYFGTSGFIKSRGIFTPELYGDNDKAYFLALGNKCAGEVVFSETVQEQNLNYGSILNETRAETNAKCFIITGDSEERAVTLAEKFMFNAGFSANSDSEKTDIVKEICSAANVCSVYISPDSGEEHSAAVIDIHPGTELRGEDVLVIPGHLSDFADMIKIGKNVVKISRQNVVFTLAVKALLMFLCLIGYCNLWFAVYIDMAAALATILNAIRAANR